MRRTVTIFEEITCCGGVTVVGLLSEYRDFSSPIRISTLACISYNKSGTQGGTYFVEIFVASRNIYSMLVQDVCYNVSKDISFVTKCAKKDFSFLEEKKQDFSKSKARGPTQKKVSSPTEICIFYVSASML